MKTAEATLETSGVGHETVRTDKGPGPSHHAVPER